MSLPSLKSTTTALVLATLYLSVHVRAEETNEVTEPATELSPAQELMLEAKRIDQKINATILLTRELETDIMDATGENLEALQLERQRQALKILDNVFELTENLHQQEELAIDTTTLRQTIISYLQRVSSGLDDYIDREVDNLVVYRSGESELKGTELVGFERNIANKLKWIQEMLHAKADTIEELKILDLPIQAHRENLNERLQTLVANLSGEIRLVADRISALEESSSVEPLDSSLKSEQQALEIRQRAIVQTFTFALGMLDENGVDTAEYRQLLLESGEVSADLFNPKILLTLLSNQVDAVLSSAASNTGPFFTRVVIFILVLLVFRVIARIVSYMIRRSFETNRVEVSQLMQDMLLSLSSRGIMILGFLVALSQMGLEITALLTGLGIAGFIVGFALQDSLANFVAGLMILAYRPYDVGDIIEAGGVTGRVNKMSLVSTTILTFDNQTLIVPNNKIWGDVIKNITLQDNRRIDLEFNISLDEDVERAKTVIRSYIDGHDKILTDPAPSIEFDRITPYSLVIIVRPWVERSEYWPIKWEILQRIREILEQEGIKIPNVNQSVVTPA